MFLIKATSPAARIPPKRIFPELLGSIGNVKRVVNSCIELFRDSGSRVVVPYRVDSYYGNFVLAINSLVFGENLLIFQTSFSTGNFCHKLRSSCFYPSIDCSRNPANPSWAVLKTTEDKVNRLDGTTSWTFQNEHDKTSIRPNELNWLSTGSTSLRVPLDFPFGWIFTCKPGTFRPDVDPWLLWNTWIGGLVYSWF